MTPPEESGREEELASELARQMGCEVEVGDGWCRINLIVEDLYDPDTNQVVTLEDPIPIAALCMLAGEDEWSVAVLSPPLTSLGQVGRFVSNPRGPVTIEVQREGVEAQLLFGLSYHGSAADAPEMLEEVTDRFMGMVCEFGPTGLQFAGIGLLEAESELVCPGFGELELCSQTLARYEVEAAIELSRTSSQIFVDAGFEEAAVRSDSLLALCYSIQGRMIDAANQLRRCEERARALSVPSRDLEASLAELSASLKATFYGDRVGAASDLERAKALGGMKDRAGTELLIRSTVPSMTSQEAAKIERGDAELSSDPEEAIDELMALSIHYRRLGDVARSVEFIEQAIELAEEHRPDSLMVLYIDLAVHCSMLGQKERAAELYATIKTLERPVGMDGLWDLVLAQVGTLFGDEEAAEQLESASEADYGMASSVGRLLSRASDIENGDQMTGLGLIDEMADLVQSTGDDLGEGLLLPELARLRLGLLGPTFGGRLDEVAKFMDHLLAGIRSHDRARYELHGVIDRSIYMNEVLESYEIAMLIAESIGRPEMVAELLERLRLLGLPDGSPDPDSGIFPVAEPTHTSVAGRSVLASDGPATDGDLPVVALEERIARQAGTGAWWWSAWMGAHYVVWAVRSPDGEIASGSEPLDPPPDEADAPAQKPSLRSLLSDFRNDVRLGGVPSRGASKVDPLAGVLGKNYVDGTEMLNVLGKRLIPAKLRAALLGADRDRPVRLLYAFGPSLAWLPVGLLGPGGASSSVRLIERATPQLMAPELASRDEVGSVGHGTLAMIDPSNDHHHLRSLAERATRVMAGLEFHRLDPDNTILATRASLMTNLAAADRFDLLLLACHARSAPPGQPLAGGLEIGAGAESTLVTVAELIEAAPLLRLPSKVVLCACSTAASAADPMTERWGVPISVLLAGAQSVVATTWDLRSCVATARFVEELVDRSRHSDLATAVRQSQLGWLDRWQRQVAAGELGFDDGSPDCAHPFIWAGFVALGDCTDVAPSAGGAGSNASRV